MAQNYSPSYLTKLKVKPVADPYSQLRAKPAGGFSATNFLSPASRAVPPVSAVKKTPPQSPFMPMPGSASRISSPTTTSQPFTAPTTPQVTPQVSMALPAAAMPASSARATLYGPGGAKEPVDVGSERASILQTQGWGLTPGSYKSPVAPSAPPITPEITTGAAPGAPGTAPGEPSAPPAPIITPETQKAYDTANKAYEESLRINPEELSTQEDLDKLIESTKTAYRNTSNQPIPLEFITGQLAAIERRAVGLAEPLERKLARLQSVRTSSIESSKFALERAESEMTRERESAQIGKEEAESARRFGVTTGLTEAEHAESARRFGITAGFTEQQMEQQKIGADRAHSLSMEKFEEDKRQFGLSYASQQRGLAISQAAAAAKSDIGGDAEIDLEKTLDQFGFTEQSLAGSRKLARASGRSGFRKGLESWLLGSTAYTELVSLTNSLRTNILVLMVDPGIKKYFGPQMTERDVELMTATGTTLNPELQGPEALNEELDRLESLLGRMKKSVLDKSGKDREQIMVENEIWEDDGTGNFVKIK